MRRRIRGRVYRGRKVVREGLWRRWWERRRGGEEKVNPLKKNNRLYIYM